MQSEHVVRICSCYLCAVPIRACGQDLFTWSMCRSSQSMWLGSVYVVYVQSQSEHVVRICSCVLSPVPIRACIQDMFVWSMCSPNLSMWSEYVHVVYMQSQSEHVVRICLSGLGMCSSNHMLWAWGKDMFCSMGIYAVPTAPSDISLSIQNQCSC